MVIPIRRYSLFAPKKNGPWRLLFFGSDDFSLASLKALNINRQCDRPLVGDLAVITNETKGCRNPVADYAKRQNLRLRYWPVHNVNELAMDDCQSFDLGIVVSFGHLIPLDMIRQFPLGMLNVHGSLLPRWRGAAPIPHTILNGDSICGVTIMKIAPHKFDVGKIVLQTSTLMPNRATTPQLTSMLSEMGAQLLIGCLGDLCNNLKNSREQDSKLATKAPKIRSSMAHLNFEDQTCLEIDRIHRAITGTSKLQTWWQGLTIRLDDIVDPEVMQTMDCSRFAVSKPSLGFKPGLIVFHKKRKILCALFKDGWVGFRTVHVERRARMTASDFYNGFLSKVLPEFMYFTLSKKKDGT